MGAAESRYARAFYALQAQSGTDDIKCSAECFDVLAEYFSGSEAVKRFMNNPLVPNRVRKEAALNLLPAGSPEHLKSLIAVLADRKRLPLIPGVAAAYRKLLTETGDLLRIQISSAFPLEDEQYNKLGKTFAERRGAKAFTVESKIDASLLGGVRVQIGDITADGTLKMKLDKLAHRIGVYA